MIFYLGIIILIGGYLSIGIIVSMLFNKINTLEHKLPYGQNSENSFVKKSRSQPKSLLTRKSIRTNHNSSKDSEQQLKSLLPYGQARQEILFIVTILHTYLLQDFIDKHRNIFNIYFDSKKSLNNQCYYPDVYTTFKMFDIDILMINEKTTQKLYYENFVPTWISVINGLINNYTNVSTSDKTNYSALLSIVENEPKLFYINGNIMRKNVPCNILTKVETFIKNNKSFLDNWQKKTNIFIEHIKDQNFSDISSNYDFIKYIQENIHPDLFDVLTEYHRKDKIHYYKNEAFQITQRLNRGKYKR